ncbi:MAG TPA: hypothetical protein VFB34_04430, partial [Chloroflexota bacterium]|nr:hypothetical protein [Chloroflexota bacterium]
MNFGSEQVELDGWLLTALEPRSEPLYLANGYLGTSLDWTGGCLPDAPPSPCFLRGVYTDPGDGGVDRLAGIPSWNRLAYSQPVRLTGYRRDLDLYRGALHTQMRLEEERGAVQVHQTVIVSRSDPHLAAIRLTVTPSFSGPIDCRAMLARPVGTGLELQGLGLEGDGTWIRMVARRYGIEVVVRLDFLAADWEPLTSRDEDSIIRGFRREVRAGETVELVQMARVSSSLDEPSHPDRVGVQGAGLNTQTFAAALRAHEEAWASLWTADVEIEGDAEAQQMVRAALFYLWSTVREDDAWSIAPMGLSSLGYNGHIFWDAELWMYPALLATHPNLAKSCLSYREQRLPAARERAASGGYRGARFPWESAF